MWTWWICSHWRKKEKCDVWSLKKSEHWWNWTANLSCKRQTLYHCATETHLNVRLLLKELVITCACQCYSVTSYCACVFQLFAIIEYTSITTKCMQLYHCNKESLEERFSEDKWKTSNFCMHSFNTMWISIWHAIQCTIWLLVLHRGIQVRSNCWLYCSNAISSCSYDCFFYHHHREICFASCH